MEIETLWIIRKSADAPPEPPELLEAWDEFSIDENPPGYKEACENALSAVGDDVEEARYITLKIETQQITDAFAPASATGQVINFRTKIEGATK